jgi:hypothetical protein
MNDLKKVIKAIVKTLFFNEITYCPTSATSLLLADFN